MRPHWTPHCAFVSIKESRNSILVLGKQKSGWSERAVAAEREAVLSWRQSHTLEAPRAFLSFENFILKSDSVPHCMDIETDDQRGEMTCPRSYSP